MKALFACLLAVVALAQQPQQPPPVISPQVNADKSVTFRLRAPNAKEVLLGRAGSPRVAMTKDDQGVWSVTTPPLEPDIYGYTFIADGVSLIDPNNSHIVPNLLNTGSAVHVPGPSSLSWEVNDVPHGAVHHRFYKSAAVGDQRDFYVYTPPGYEGSSKKAYPVLYLFHGFSDDASGWTAVGRANVILDNLIAQGKAKPMVVVMPLGYGAPEIVARGAGGGLRSPELRQKNYDRFRDSVLNELIPMVEKDYRVTRDRRYRAIAGLSMGGAESLYIGLNALDRFSWIGAFSAGGQSGEYAQTFPNLNAKANSQIRLLWIGCGTEDRLIESNRKFREWLKAQGVEHSGIETPGAHTWLVWRRYLTTFSSLLFQDKTTSHSAGSADKRAGI
ncbi:MAG: alpha/beta hydrolase-fold protein [Bryobacteraceae bacterium]